MRIPVGPTPSNDEDMVEVRSMVQSSFAIETCTMVNKMMDRKIGKRPHNRTVDIACRGDL